LRSLLKQERYGFKREILSLGSALVVKTRTQRARRNLLEKVISWGKRNGLLITKNYYRAYLRGEENAGKKVELTREGLTLPTTRSPV